MSSNMTRQFGAGWWAAGVLLGLAVTVGAQTPDRGPGMPPPGGPRGGPGGGLPAFFMRLDLTEEQRTQVRGLMDQQREERKAQRDELRTVHQQLAAAIYGGATDGQSVPDADRQAGGPPTSGARR